MVLPSLPSRVVTRTEKMVNRVKEKETRFSVSRQDEVSVFILQPEEERWNG